MLPLSFIGHEPAHVSCGVYALQAGVAAEFSVLQIAAGTRALYMTGLSAFIAGGDYYFGKSAATVLDGADAALDGSACVFGAGVRTATPRKGTSTVVLDSDAHKVAGQTLQVQAVPFPLGLFIDVGEFFYLVRDGANLVLEASLAWTEV